MMHHPHTHPTTETPRRSGGWFTTSVALAALVYFAIHGLTGEAGVPAWIDARQKAAALETELSHVRAERVFLEDRVARLRDDSLDLDYLEERARALVHVARPDDILIPYGALTAVFGSAPFHAPAPTRLNGVRVYHTAR